MTEDTAAAVPDETRPGHRHVRTEIVSARFTAAELEAITARATLADVTVSTFVRNLAVEALSRGAEVPVPGAVMPPPVADFGPVRLELMGHRYREGRLSEVVIAGQPFLRLDLAGGHVEYYRPDAVYCITPGVAPPVPLAAIPRRFGDLLDDDDEEPLENTTRGDDGDDWRSW